MGSQKYDLLCSIFFITEFCGNQGEKVFSWANLVCSFVGFTFGWSNWLLGMYGKVFKRTFALTFYWKPHVMKKSAGDWKKDKTKREVGENSKKLLQANQRKENSFLVSKRLKKTDDKPEGFFFFFLRKGSCFFCFFFEKSRSFFLQSVLFFKFRSYFLPSD